MNNTTKRKFIEETLSNPELFLRQVIENAGGVPFQLIFGRSLGTGYYKYVGTGIKDLLGVPPNEFTEKLFGSLVEEFNPLLPEIPIDPAECRRKMVKGDIPHYKADIRIRTTKGEVKWINDSSLPIRDDKTDKIIGAQGILIDIDKRKRIEKDTEQNISLLRATLESTADGILVVDSSGKISGFNERFVKMWRIPQTIIATRDDQKAIDFVLDQLKDPGGFLAKVGELYTNPEADSFDLLKFKDGRYFERYSHPQRIGEQPVGRVWSFRDVTERKRAEEHLRQSEEFFRDISYSMADWIWEVDKDGKYTFAGGKVKQILEYEPQELIGKTPFELMPEAEAKRVGAIFQKIVSGKEPIIELENWNLTKTGKEVCLLTNGVPIKNERGELMGYRGVDKDITERKKMEKALQESESRVKTILDTNPTGIMLVDKNTRKIVLMNNVAVNMVGLPGEQILGRICHSFICPAEVNSCPVCDLGQKVDRSERVLIQSNGNRMPILKSVVEIKIGGEDCLLESFIDITERKRAEETLRESEERYRKLVETAPDVIYSLAEDGTITSLNPAFESITGWASSEWLGKQFIPLVHPDDVPLAIETFKKALNEEKLPPYELRILSKSGEYIVGEFTSTSLIKKGKVAGEFGIARNITERKHAQELLTASEESYRGLFNSLDDAIYVQDTEGKFLDVNEGAVEMYGYPREYFIGKTPEFLSAPGKNDLTATMEAIQRAFAGEPQQFEWWGIHKNGKIFPKDVKLKKGIYHGKDVIIAIARDITVPILNVW